MAIHSSRGILTLWIFFKLIHVDSEAQEAKIRHESEGEGGRTLAIFFIGFLITLIAFERNPSTDL